jgi:hypothetical protein
MKRIFGGESLIASENQGNAHDIRLNGGGQGRSGLHLQVSGAASQEKLEDLGGKTPRGVPAPPPELASVYVDVVARAYERSSLLVTTNLSFENWTEVLGSELLVAQIQSTSIVVGGRVVRAIPMVDGKGMIPGGITCSRVRTGRCRRPPPKAPEDLLRRVAGQS